MMYAIALQPHQFSGPRQYGRYLRETALQPTAFVLAQLPSTQLATHHSNGQNAAVVASPPRIVD